MSEPKKSVYKPRPVSGFPEWLPEVRLVEQQWFDHIRAVFESYGFCSIETPSVEELDVLTAKGEVDKEIYVIERLHKEDGDKKEARLALHFDQTVPLARYVAQNFNELVFPFKRYQMQRVWRGERPQAGRFREFYQCDIDVINVDALPMHFDAELPAVMWEILTGLPGMEGEKIQMQVSNRKILMGLLEGFSITDAEYISEVLRSVDKLEKRGDAFVEESIIELSLRLEFGKDKGKELAKTIIDLKNTQLSSIKSVSETMTKGLEELDFVLNNLKHLPAGSIVPDLSIVRGLDYYTGIVYETRFVDDPSYGSICSGGRYDDLAGSYINKKLPGVGISIGFSRLFDRMRLAGKLPTGRKSPADILVTIPSEDRRALAASTAQALRHRGLKVEMYHAPKKIPDQMKYASRKGIPYVWFPPFEDGRPHEVKNMGTGSQAEADPENWQPEGKQSSC
jgi:histidyl-tRNA synthetase